jgi:hypothetical protein
MQAPQIAFRPFIEVGGVYDTGLTGVAVNQQGDLGMTSAYGVQITGGVSGVHSWRHTKLGLDYRGSVNHYNKKTYYDNADQSLMLGLTHQFTRHTTLALRESAGFYSRSFGLAGLPQTVPFDPSSTYAPTTDFFDNRTIYLSSQADLTWQKSRRLSLNAGGDAFLVRRRSSALYGVSGGGARGDLQYRLSARSTVGVAYTFTQFSYRGVFSGTALHGLAASYGVRLTRWWEFSAYGGFMRAETKFLQNVQVDPAIAAIIGTPYGAVIIHRIDYAPNVGARLSRTFRRGVAYVSAGHSMTPGNGLFLTSSSTSAGGGYSYTGLRHWSFNMQAGWDRAKSLTNVLGYYGSTSGGFSASRDIGHGLHAVATFSARQYQSPDFSKYNRLIYTARIALGFTPGDIPLRVW